MSFPTLRFDNRNLEQLPVDKSRLAGTRRVPGAIFSLVDPTPVLGPVRLVASSGPALALVGLGLSTAVEGGAAAGNLEDYIDSNPALLEAFAGNTILPGSSPAAHCYAGHQFGSFAGQLGDGAAIYLGEVVNESGERWEMQLKGAGPTPYSRHADGRKVLRSSLREFLASEAVHALRIPSTRAGSIVVSQSLATRDPLYSGDVKQENCAVVLRIAPNFFRFGSFEIFKCPETPRSPSGPSAANEALKQTLLDHVVSSYFTESTTSPPMSRDADTAEAHERFFRIVTSTTAGLVARWQAYGFVHGVLNTDNMSIMGITIDYGPYAFMEHFDFDLVPNGSDGSARYTYGAQPEICRWNLMKLAEALDPLLPEAKSEVIVESMYQSTYLSTYTDLMRKRLGLLFEQPGDIQLIESLLKVLNETSCDYNDFFRAITLWAEASASDICATSAAYSASADKKNEQLAISRIVSRCAAPRVVETECLKKLRILKRPSAPPERIFALMQAFKTDPAQICASFGGVSQEDLAEELQSEFQLSKVLEATMQKLKQSRMLSIDEKARLDEAKWKDWIESYRARLQVDASAATLSSSTTAPGAGEWARVRAGLMTVHNPTFILRNWIAQSCIAAAESGNYAKARTVLRMLQDPWNPAHCSFTSPLLSVDPAPQGTPQAPPPELEFLTPRPIWAANLLCTCSS